MAKRFKVTASANRSRIQSRNRRITAADEDFEDIDGQIDNVDDTFNDTLDDVSDTVEDIQDAVTDDKEDEVNIDIENNIDDHYIAECEKCHGIFISATVESDQEVTKVTGECPLCGEETDQYLKWIVKKVSHAVPEPDAEAYMHNQV